ncbi:MAG: hypothetical protein JWN46_2100 [Acidimicrobiales bacterium]|nr:hypothetical protein [Acidimicrobiales bacterium]
MPGAMGQPIAVIEKPSSNRGVVRFETNRALTGMGHERYTRSEDAWGDRPPDELARRLFARGGIDRVHINSNVVTVDLTRGFDASGIKEIIEGLYIHYPPGAETADTADPVAAAGDPAEVAEATAEQAPTDTQGGPAPEMATDTAEQADAAGPPIAPPADAAEPPTDEVVAEPAAVDEVAPEPAAADEAAADTPAAEESAADEPVATKVAGDGARPHVSPVEAEAAARADDPT